MLFAELGYGLEELFVGAIAVFVGGRVVASVLRRRGLRWTWALLGFPVGYVLFAGNALYEWSICGAAAVACWIGASWQDSDIAHGADLAEAARARLEMLELLSRWNRRVAIRRGLWVAGGRLVVGIDVREQPVSIPVGYTSGCHTLVVGATGSGKTVSEAWIAGRLIDAGHGAIVIDPKGDELLREELQDAAERRDVRFLEWTPQGPLAYNPYANGTDTEIADKALSGEVFTEPHYLR
jgi:hypothetical protein